MMIFIVEHDDIIRIPLEDDLRETGYQVRSFNNPSGALDALLWNPVDVVIADVSDNTLASLEFVSRIKRIKPRVNVIIMSDNVVLGSKEMFKALKIGYILKPFHFFYILNLLDGMHSEVTAQ